MKLPTDNEYKRLMSAAANNELDRFLSSESAKTAFNHAGSLQARYGGMLPHFKELREALGEEGQRNSSHRRVSQIGADIYNMLDPMGAASALGLYRSDLEDIKLLKFLSNLRDIMGGTIFHSATRLTRISNLLNSIIPALEGDDMRAAIQGIAEEDAGRLVSLILEEFGATVIGFDKVLGGVYLATKQEYRRLRRLFLGESIKPGDDNDNMEENILMSMFGSKPPRNEKPIGPAVALVDDNCVLTQLLMDVSGSLPKPYEKAVPLKRRGKMTGDTKTVKILDDSEVEDFSRSLIRLSAEEYLGFVQDPPAVLVTVMKILRDFYGAYLPICEALRKILPFCGASLSSKDIEHKLGHPDAIGRQYSRINFLAIRPSPEDTAPKTKADHDYAAARVKLFDHLKGTIFTLSVMDKDAEGTEQFSIVRVKAAIELRSAMEEVTKTEYQRQLNRNIHDDNEFYVSKSGNLGSLEVERAPAPKITYEDVVGLSFVKAKQHVEEVVKVASHPHTMRLTAPRGDIRSNLLLIGPFGCHRKGQGILMYDGSIRKVEDVLVGDLLMGLDSTPRKVEKLVRGVDEMAEIIPYYGNPWVVNRHHILSLTRDIGDRARIREFTDMSVADYLEQSLGDMASPYCLYRIPMDFGTIPPQKAVRGVLSVGFSIRLLPPEDFYGFVLDGDHRYLLDDFTVTHNCGKSEITKAIGSDKRIIGFNVSTADMLTAYMHESVKNVKRLYDHAKNLRRNSRYTKPVGILLDEFDRFFTFGEGVNAAYDGGRMTGILQEMMDGIVGYEGVFMVGLTNVPKSVPPAVLRRFKYVDVVGQLTVEERATLMRKFLAKGLPLDPEIGDVSYLAWGESLDNAPGDVIGKVCDEVHFKFMHEFVKTKEGIASGIERILSKRLRDREIKDADRVYVRKALAKVGIITSQQITEAMESVLKQPQVQLQIEAAKTCYRDAEEIMNGLAVAGKTGFGFGADKVARKSVLWGGRD